MAKYVKNSYANKWGTKGSYLDKDVAIKIVPAPVGGWDAISPLAAMEAKYAASIINWVPRPGWIELRGGYNAWAQGITALPVNSLMCYRPPSGVETLFAASGTQIWDASIVGVPALSKTGTGGDKYQYVNFTPALGANYLMAVNGVDLGILTWNGTTWVTQTITGTGVVPFSNINVFKRRVWVIPNNSTLIYFLGTDNITGAGTPLDLGAFMTLGGYLIAMGTWTVDGGNGPDDLAVFITSKGQAIIYKGTDPTNANAWSLVGVFNIPIPIGRRCFLRFGSDLLLITTQGVLPLSQALPFDPSASRSVALTNRIQNAMLIAAQSYSTNFGWQLLAFPQQSLMVLNIPQSTNQTQVQFVMNTLTGAWTQFNGWNANCFELFNESLYFGDNAGNVNLAYAGGLDLVSPILADVKCAFNYLEEPGRIKNANMIRPFLVADGTLVPTIQIDVDFENSSVSAPVTILTPTGAVWDVSNWDAASWSTGTSTVINWLSCNALGTALAIRMIVNLAGGGSSGSAAATSVFDTGVFDTMIFDGNGATIQSGTGIPVLQVNVFEISVEYGGPV